VGRGEGRISWYKITITKRRSMHDPKGACTQGRALIKEVIKRYRQKPRHSNSPVPSGPPTPYSISVGWKARDPWRGIDGEGKSLGGEVTPVGIFVLESTPGRLIEWTTARCALQLEGDKADVLCGTEKIPCQSASPGRLTCELGDLRNEHPCLLVHVESGESVIETPRLYCMVSSEVPEHDFPVKT